MKAPLVVTSIYPLSWHLSERWTMRVASFVSYSRTKLGGLQYGGGDPLAVIVGTSARLDLAARTWPRARMIWFLDNATHVSNDPRVVGHLALNSTIARTAKVRTPVHVIPLAFTPRPRFGWRAQTLWTMQNGRDNPAAPNSFRRENQSILDSILVRRPGLLRWHQIFGIGQLGGPLDMHGKERLYRGCSAYVAALRRTAGLSLASHEAMAAGVPLVGNLWPGVGDHDGMLGGISPNLDLVAKLAERVCEDEDFAHELSEQGLAFIRDKRSLKRMDCAIEKFLDELSSIEPSRARPRRARRKPPPLREVAPGSFFAPGRRRRLRRRF